MKGEGVHIERWLGYLFQMLTGPSFGRCSSHFSLEGGPKDEPGHDRRIVFSLLTRDHLMLSQAELVSAETAAITT